MPHRMKERTKKNQTLRDKLKYQIPTVKLALVMSNIPAKLYAIVTPRCIEKFLEPVRLSPNEQFVAVYLNSKHEVIGLHVISEGTLSSSLVHPREVFKGALLCNAYAIVVAHNHPSGSELSPSPEDDTTTKTLIEAGAMLGVPVIDHLILSPVHEAYSFRESQPELWRK